MDGTNLCNEEKWEFILCLFRSHATAVSELAKNYGIDKTNWLKTTERTGGHPDKKMTFYVFFNDQCLINYSTDHITTKPGRKIESA